MKKIFCSMAVAVLAFLSNQEGIAGERLTIGKLLASPQKHLEKEVTVSGYMRNVRGYSGGRFMFALLEREETNKKRAATEVDFTGLPEGEKRKLFGLQEAIRDALRGEAGDLWEKGQEGLITVKGIWKKSGKSYFIDLVEFPDIGASEDMESGEKTEGEMHGLTLFISASDGSRGSDSRLKELSAKISSDDGLREKIRDRVAEILQVKGSPQGSKQYTAVIRVELKGNGYLITPDIWLLVAEGKQSMSGIKSLRIKGRVSEKLILAGPVFRQDNIGEMMDTIIKQSASVIANDITVKSK